MLSRIEPRSVTLIASIALALPLHPQAPAPDLPAGGFVVERASVPANVHRDREMVLWMIAPKRFDRGPLAGKPYSCPESTRGSYYSGPTRVSLADTASRKILNTVKIRRPSDGEDTFDIPYRILAGGYYSVPGTKRDEEGKPRLLGLRDLNGDGLPLEAAFYQAVACMGLPTTLIGYSPRQDRVIQYETELKVSGPRIVVNKGYVPAGSVTTETALWIDYLFAQKPKAPGHWSYEIDYTGRLGALDSYDIRYDKVREKFLGSRVSMVPPFVEEIHEQIRKEAERNP